MKIANQFLILIITVLMTAIRLNAATVPGTLAGVVLRTLPNGLKLIVREQKSAPLVAIDIWVKAGSGHELPDESGAAHFLEHMLFKGTATRKPGDVDAAIEDLGGCLSAGTNRNGAHFYTTISDSDVDAAMEVLADVIQHAAIDPVEMERERAVILDEVARLKNDKYALIESRLFEVSFKNSPFARPILGEIDSLKTIKRDVVDRFYKRLFIPNNTTVVIVGKITPAKAEELVTKQFANWEKRDIPGPAPAIVFPDSSQPKVLPLRSTSAVRIGFGVAANIKGDMNASLVCRLLVSILSNQGFGRFNDALNRAGIDFGPIVPDSSRPSFAPLPVAEPPDVHSELIEIGAGGLLVIHVGAVASQRAAVDRAALAVFDELQRNPVTISELNAAKYRLLGGFVADSETFAGQARLLGLWDALGDCKVAEEFGLRLQKLKTSDLLDAAKTWFEPARINEATVPLKGP